MLIKASTSKGWIKTFFKKEEYRTFCFNSNKNNKKNKENTENIENQENIELKSELIKILKKYNITKYKIIHYYNNEIISYTVCLKENIYNDLIYKIKNQEVDSCYNCFPIF